MQPSLERERRPELREEIQAPDSAIGREAASRFGLTGNQPPRIYVVTAHDRRERGEARMAALCGEYRSQISLASADSARRTRDVAVIKSIDKLANANGQLFRDNGF